MRPIERFLAVEAASGLVLLANATIALVWANSRFGDGYHHLWETPLSISIGRWGVSWPLHFWINDVLMTLFFFVVGLEIRREIACGELSEPRRAALPAVAALGGMVVPALLYTLVNHGTGTERGWGVPMATDIAFAVGALALLGKRVTPALRVLLLALAVIDDIGGIVVIALFYSSSLAPSWLALSALGIALIVLLQKLAVRSPLAYVVPSAIVWLGAYKGGVHPTLSGVVAGMMTPAVAWYGVRGFLDRARAQVALFEETAAQPSHTAHDLLHHLGALDEARREAISPVERLQAALHGVVAYGIMPLFALANAGVSLRGLSLDDDAWRAISGVSLGLVVGKPIGIVLASLALTWLGVVKLPRGVGAAGLLCVGMVGGIGFTMALFVAQLAFEPGNALQAAKAGILGATALAGVLGLTFGRLALRPPAEAEGAAATEADAEAQTDA